MKKHIISLFLVLVLMIGVFTLVGCGKDTNKNSKLVGTWEYKEEGFGAVYSFKSNGTGSLTLTAYDESDSSNFTYKVKDDKILITFDGDTDVFELKYRVKGNNLIIKDSFDEETQLKKKTK